MLLTDQGLDWGEESRFQRFRKVAVFFFVQCYLLIKAWTGVKNQGFRGFER